MSSNPYNFLPADYRARSAVRKDQTWRGTAALIAGVLFGIGVAGSLRTTAIVQQQRDAALAAVAELPRVNSSSMETVRLEAQADLLATFVAPTSSYEMLSLLADTAPDGIHLTKFSLRRVESKAAKPGSTRRQNDRAAKTATSSAAILMADIESRTHVSRAMNIVIEGVGRDDHQISSWIARLAEQDGVDLSLTLSEPTTLRGFARRKFTITVHVTATTPQNEQLATHDLKAGELR